MSPEEIEALRAEVARLTEERDAAVTEARASCHDADMLALDVARLAARVGALEAAIREHLAMTGQSAYVCGTWVRVRADGLRAALGPAGMSEEGG